MQRYKLTLEYDGTPFVGWQRQENGLGVQQVLEEAVTAFCAETVNAFAAGRTDAGVHALGQVAHIDLEKDTDADTVRDALNYHMKPHPVAVVVCEAVDDEFHARFSAQERVYQYRIVNRRAPLALAQHRAWLVPVALNADAMNDAAQTLVGKHDFSTFRAAECQSSSPVKTIDKITVARAGDNIFVSVRARSFLHHQVRNIVGTLKYVGDGKWTKDDVQSALEKRDRAAGGPTAPAAGLFLTHVCYPD